MIRIPIKQPGFQTTPTLPETNIAPENRPKPNRKVVFQPSIFRGEHVSFREGISIFAHQKKTGALHGQIEAEGAQALLAACMEDLWDLDR